MRLPGIGQSTIAMPSRAPRWPVVFLVLMALFCGRDALASAHSSTEHVTTPGVAAATAQDYEDHHTAVDLGSSTVHRDHLPLQKPCRGGGAIAAIHADNDNILPQIAPILLSNAMLPASIGWESVAPVDPIGSASARRALLQVYLI